MWTSDPTPTMPLAGAPPHLPRIRAAVSKVFGKHPASLEH